MKEKEFIEKIDTLKRKGDILVAIEIKYFDKTSSIINELLLWDFKTNDYIWETDWREAADEIEIVGYMFIRDIDIAGSFITPKENSGSGVGEPPEPPGEELGYDPFMGCFTDEC